MTSFYGEAPDVEQTAPCDIDMNFATSLQIWNVHSVLNVLHSLVEKSNINKQLDVFSSMGTLDRTIA